MENGGLKMIHIRTFDKALKISWVKKDLGRKTIMQIGRIYTCQLLDIGKTFGY